MDHNPDTHILCEDGKVYERKIITATGVAVGMKVAGQAQAPLHKAMEMAISDAVLRAHALGMTDPKQIKALMMKARDEVLYGDWVSYGIS